MYSKCILSFALLCCLLPGQSSAETKEEKIVAIYNNRNIKLGSDCSYFYVTQNNSGIDLPVSKNLNAKVKVSFEGATVQLSDSLAEAIHQLGFSPRFYIVYDKNQQYEGGIIGIAFESSSIDVYLDQIKLVNR